MKNRYFLTLLTTILTAFSAAFAQTTVQIGTGTTLPTNTLYGPVYRYSATSTTTAARSNILYTAAEMAAAGIPTGATITKVEFNKGNTGNFVTPANYGMLMANTTNTSLSTSLTWASVVSTHTVVYTNTSFNIPSAPGWVSWQLNTPFVYTGNALEIATEHTMVGNGGATANFLWEYSGTSGSSASLIVGATGTTPPATLSATVADYKNRPNIRITYTTGSAQNDASITALVSPQKFCPGSQTVKVRVKNAGKNRLDSVNVAWEVDNVGQTPITFRSTLDTTGGTGASDTVLTLGTVNFAANDIKVIRVWTAMPNGVADTTTGNDTIVMTLRPGLGGTYVVDPSSSDFISVGAAVAALNQYGVCGPSTFNVTAGTIYTERPIILTQSGTATNFIKFQKNGSGANPLIYGINGTGSSDAVIALAGASHVTFDGIDVADSASNATTATQMEYGYGITNAVINAVVTGSSGNVIKNAKITLKRTNTATIGLAQSTLVAAVSLSGANHNNRYESIRVENSYNGILLQGTAAFPDSNNVITSSGSDSTIVGGLTANDIGNGTTIVTGILCSEQKNVEVSKCTVRNLTHTSTALSSGIWIDNASTTVDYGKARVFGNTVFNLSRTSTSTTGSMTGIRIDVSTTATAVVYNNIIYGLSNGSPTATANILLRGIGHAVLTSANGNAEYYHNSISINNGTALTASSACLWKAGTGSIVYRNNIFSNTTAAQTGAAKHFGVYISAGTVSSSSNNIFWTPNANGFAGYMTSDRATLPLFAAAISPAAPSDGNERGSAAADPNFTSASNLNFGGSTPAALSGTPVTSPAITSDITGGSRSTTAPTIGAFETSQSLIDSSAPVISNVIAFNGTSPAIYATISDNSAASSAGSVTLWYRNGTTGAYSSAAPDSVPSGSINGTYKWGASLSSLSAGLYEFYIAARDQAGSGRNISVNPIQDVTFNGFASSDPVGYLANPDAGANRRTFLKPATLAGGTYSVGPTGTYANLTAVANLLNASDLTGNVIFQLQTTYDGTTGETFPIVFNEVSTVGGNWTVTIRPETGATARVTSGDPGSAAALIRLNGADRFTFDGRPGGTGTTGEWTIRNTRTAATLSPAIQFINDAKKDTLRYLTIESGNTVATSGTILISTTNMIAGNDSIVISNNKIRDRSDVAGIPANAIYSAGTTLMENNNITIEDNQIFNFTGLGIGVTAAGNGDNWKINNNHFYFNNGTATTAQTSISFLAATNGNQINNNYIGGSTVNAGGSAWANSGANAFIGITAAFEAATTASVSGNVIRNIAKSATGAASFTGILVSRGNANITNNVIGDTVTANSITTAGTGVTLGISITNTLPSTTTAVDFNRIANITSANAGTGAIVRGISYSSSSNNPLCHIRNNRIFNLSTNAATTGYAAGSIAGQGIYFFPTGYTYNCQVTNNTIYNITGTNPTAVTNITGMTLTNFQGTIANNTVYDIKNASAAPTSPTPATANGMYFRFLDTYTSIYNNMVSLNSTLSDSVQMNGIMITGANGGAQLYYYNSVHVGNTSGSPVKSFAFHRGENSTTTQSYQPVVMRNNLFINTVTSAGQHYAVGNEGARPDSSWIITENNYNDFYSVNSGVSTLWGTTSGDLASWKTLSLGDTNSVYRSVQYVNPAVADLHLTGTSLGDTVLAGRPITGITTDFDGQTRHASRPYMGADENLANPLPVELITLSGLVTDNGVLLKWATASEKNSSHFEVERKLNADWVNIGNVDAAGRSTDVRNYSIVDGRPFANGPVEHYRLKIVDLDGSFDYSNTVTVKSDNKTAAAKMQAYPNPFTEMVSLEVYASANAEAIVEVADITGKTVISVSKALFEGQNTLEVHGLASLKSGMYFITVVAEGEKYVTKMIKN